MTIPYSAIVRINPAVLAGGGAAIALNGVMLTNSTQVPIGSLLPFPSRDAVSAYFGPSALETTLAGIYFSGYDNSTAKPGNLFFSQYNTAAVSAYVRGGSLAGMTLAALKALTGTLIVTLDGVVKTSSSITLTAATSFSNAATIIQAAFTSLGGTVTYDSVAQAFKITSSSTGVASTMSIVSGTLATALAMTQATGAVLSQGADIATPAGAMTGITGLSLNWVAFMTAFEPSTADKLLFATWTSQQNNRYAYIAWDSDATAIQSGNTTSFGPQVLAANYSGVMPAYNNAATAAFVLGSIASIDTGATDGRITFKFKGQAGLLPTVTDQTAAANLAANGYNYYAAYGGATSTINIFEQGTVSGPFKWLDTFVNQIWLNANLQGALITLLASVSSVPYTQQGNNLIEAALTDPIQQAVDFGAIRAGVPLSASQAAQVNAAAGAQIDRVLATRGWYLKIGVASAQVRALRGSPPITFWYMDGGAVHSINVASIAIQ